MLKATSRSTEIATAIDAFPRKKALLGAQTLSPIRGADASRSAPDEIPSGASKASVNDPPSRDAIEHILAQNPWAIWPPEKRRLPNSMLEDNSIVRTAPTDAAPRAMSPPPEDKYPLGIAIYKVKAKSPAFEDKHPHVHRIVERAMGKQARKGREMKKKERAIAEWSRTHPPRSVEKQNTSPHRGDDSAAFLKALDARVARALDQDEQHCIQTLDEDILAAWPSLRYRKSVSGKCMPKVKCVPRAKAPSHWLTARAKVAARVALQIAPSPAPKVVIAKHDVPQDEESEAVGDRMQREHQHGEGKKSAPLVDAMEIVRRKGWTRPCEDAVWRRVRHLQLRRITKNEAMAFLHDFPLRAHWSVRQLSMGVGAIARVAFLFASSAIHLHCARAILSLEKPVLLKDEDVQLFHFCFQFIAQIGELWSRKESAPNDGNVELFRALLQAMAFVAVAHHSVDATPFLMQTLEMGMRGGFWASWVCTVLRFQEPATLLGKELVRSIYANEACKFDPELICTLALAADNQDALSGAQLVQLGGYFPTHRRLQGAVCASLANKKLSRHRWSPEMHNFVVACAREFPASHTIFSALATMVIAEPSSYCRKDLELLLRSGRKCAHEAAAQLALALPLPWPPLGLSLRIPSNLYSRSAPMASHADADADDCAASPRIITSSNDYSYRRHDGNGLHSVHNDSTPGRARPQQKATPPNDENGAKQGTVHKGEAEDLRAVLNLITLWALEGAEIDKAWALAVVRDALTLQGLGAEAAWALFDDALQPAVVSAISQIALMHPYPPPPGENDFAYGHHLHPGDLTVACAKNPARAAAEARCLLGLCADKHWRPPHMLLHLSSFDMDIVAQAARCSRAIDHAYDCNRAKKEFSRLAGVLGSLELVAIADALRSGRLANGILRGRRVLPRERAIAVNIAHSYFDRNLGRKEWMRDACYGDVADEDEEEEEEEEEDDEVDVGSGNSSLSEIVRRRPFGLVDKPPPPRYETLPAMIRRQEHERPYGLLRNAVYQHTVARRFDSAQLREHEITPWPDGRTVPYLRVPTSAAHQLPPPGMFLDHGGELPLESEGVRASSSSTLSTDIISTLGDAAQIVPSEKTPSVAWSSASEFTDNKEEDVAKLSSAGRWSEEEEESTDDANGALSEAIDAAKAQVLRAQERITAAQDAVASAVEDTAFAAVENIAYNVQDIMGGVAEFFEW